MKDCKKEILQPGDRVVYTSSGYMTLNSGVVEGFTAKSIRIRVGSRTVCKPSSQVAKVFNQE